MLEKDKNKLIISADDFGISRIANKKILELVKLGKIERVAVMMSDNLNPEDVRVLLDSRVILDIHLHLAKDKIDHWQTEPRDLKEGAIKRIIVFCFNYLSGKTGSKMVELEWTRQIEKFKEVFGKNPDGIGSHEHIHFFSPYFKVVLKLSRKFKIPYMRFGTESMKKENVVSIILNWLRKINMKTFNSYETGSSDFLVSYDWVENLDSFVEKLPEGKKTELVFHPERDEEFEVMNKYF